MRCRQGYQSYLPQLLSGNPLGPRQSQRVRGQEGPPGLDHHVRQLLGGRPVPQLAQAACDCSPQQCLELLFAATQKFREEWLQRLEACQLLIGRRWERLAEMDACPQAPARWRIGDETRTFPLLISSLVNSRSTT